MEDNKEFIAWDGEGITYEKDAAQEYVLFGCSKGNYVQKQILRTPDCLHLLIDCAVEYPNAYHVAFAFDYDVEMILRDMPVYKKHLLHVNTQVKWKGYNFLYIKGKMFRVSRNGTSITIYDMFSFFACSFVKALVQYLGNDDSIEQIASGKSQRNEFEYKDVESLIKPYWQMELDYMVRLANQLNDYLLTAGIRITKFYGPGAVANQLNKVHKTKTYMDKCPTNVNDASQYAYAGGRFELFQMGHYEGPIYQYDINSAYPFAISRLPRLDGGTWEHVDEFIHNADFAIYYIEFCKDQNTPLMFSPMPLPLFHRGQNGNITFPYITRGWYWEPEVRKAIEYFPSFTTVIEGYVFHPQDFSVPFQWVKDMYYQRQDWKKRGNPAQLALKLGLNSLYGKMAQRSGWEHYKSAPPLHQLEWAGWVTSYTRAKLYDAMMQAVDMKSRDYSGLISCETDSVMTTVPLDLPMSNNLGDWGLDKYNGISYLQSGIYWAKDGNEWKPKFRGISSDTISHDDVVRFFNETDFTTRNYDGLTGEVTRFVGMGRALHSTNNLWRRWITESREISPGKTGKRRHISEYCNHCNGSDFPMHHLETLPPDSAESTKHILPWEDEREIQRLINMERGMIDDD